MNRSRSLALIASLALTATTLPAAVAVAGESDDISGTPSASVSAPAAVGSGVGAGVGFGGGASSQLPAAAFSSAMVSALTTASNVPVLAARTSGLVMNADTGVVEWSKTPGVTRMPASTQKVLTAYTVLRSMPSSRTLTTRAIQSLNVPTNLYLVGGGDPSLTPARLRGLASDVANQLKGKGLTKVTLYLDDSIFPQPVSAQGWKASYLDGDVQRVRGLTLAGYRGLDGGVAAGNVFASALKTAGVVATVSGRGVAPANRAVLGRTDSASVGSMIGTMLSVSSNDYAEFLLRQAAVAKGLRPTWTNSLANQRSVLTKANVPLTGYMAYDGSGLSRMDRMPVTTMASVLRKLYANPADKAVVFSWGAIPRSGQTGTLKNRFKVASQACAQGKVLAKTGTLGDVVGLAGVARSVDGTARVFVLLENGSTDTSSARLAIDSVATAAVGCRLS